MKTNEEYAAKGSECPFCSSVNIESTEIPQCKGSGEFTQMIVCLNCGKQWNDLYKLTGYEEVEE